MSWQNRGKSYNRRGKGAASELTNNQGKAASDGIAG
jgi:hypothetical protein